MANVIADAPCFADYQELDALFPNSKFVYLNRALDAWLPSMQMLLTKMLPELAPKTGYLNPVLKRCMNNTFMPFSAAEPLSREHLTQCYLAHQKTVQNYFANRNDLLSIDISQTGSLKQLLDFIGIDAQNPGDFPRLNMGKQVDSWKEFKHPNKVNALSAGKEHRKFFTYHTHR